LKVPVAAVVLAVGVSTACGVPPERSVLDEFFAASRLRDKTALSRCSTVIFEPLEQGIVVDFEITHLTPEKDNRKDVTIAAPVRLPNGSVVLKTLEINLQRTIPPGDPGGSLRWIVTGVQER
jgi:hypothetical protein